MIPWNPTHRYSGMTSHFDSLDGFGQAEVATSQAGDRNESPASPAAERAPLGFVDVRAESPAGGAGMPPQADPDIPAAPQVELTVVADATAGHEAEMEERIPFYKREISLGRRKHRPEPVAGPPLEAVADEAPEVEETAVETAAPADVEEHVPFYKRELSFRRDGAAGHEPAAAEHEPVLQAVDAAPAEPEPVVADEPVAIPAQPEPIEPEPVTAEPEPVAVAAVAEHVPEPAESISVEPVSVVVAPVEPQPAAEPVFVPEASTPRGVPQKKQKGGRRSGKRIVGLKIGASQLAAAVVERGEHGHELVELARTPLEPGIVLDGEVRDGEALTAALRAFFAEQKLPTKDIRVGIASNRIGVRTFEIAGVDDESRFDNAVRFKAHEVLPIAVSDSVLDYRVLEERRTESGEIVRKILLVVAPRDQVVPYVEASQRAGLKLAGVDLEALGLLRAFVEPNAPRVAGGTSTVVVAIGHEASTLLVSGGGACEFTRVFDWGGATLQEAIAQELQIHPLEAATVLRHLSLTGNSRRVEGIDDAARNRAVEAVRLRLTPFARELVSSLQFYQTQPDSLGIGEIVITGGTSQLDGLGDALHQMIGVQVRVGNPLERVTVRRGVESGFEHSLGSLAVPIGLAIDDDAMRTVDLTPKDVAKAAAGSRRRNLAPVLIPVAAAVPLVALGFAFTQAHGKVSNRQSQLSSLSAKYAAMPTPTQPQIDAGLGSAEAARASAIAQVLGSRTSWDGMLRDLARVMPQNVWLTDLKAAVSSPLSSVLVGTPGASASTTTSSGAAPAAPQGVTLTGYTYEQADVAKLLSRLVALPTLQNVQLRSASTSPVGKKDVVQFTILADLRGVGGAS